MEVWGGRGAAATGGAAAVCVRTFLMDGQGDLVLVWGCEGPREEHRNPPGMAHKGMNADQPGHPVQCTNLALLVSVCRGAEGCHQDG